MLSLLLLLAGTLACSPARKTDVHSERAHDLMLQAQAKAGPDGPDYTDPIWMEVIEELSQVDSRYVGYEKDMALLEEIKTVRAAAFLAMADEEAEKRRAEQDQQEQLDQRIDEMLQGDPFRPGGSAPSGAGTSEPGNYQVILEQVETRREGGRFIVTGRILNVSGRRLDDPLVMVDFLDGRGNVLGTAQSMIEPLVLPSSGRGSFRVSTRDRDIRRYRLRLRELAGDELSFRSPQD